MSLSVDNALLNVRTRNLLFTRAHVKQPHVYVMGVSLAYNSQYIQLGCCSLSKSNRIWCGGLTCHFGSTKVLNASLAWLSPAPYVTQPTKNLSRVSTQWLGLKQSLICILELYGTCQKRLQTACRHFTKLYDHYALVKPLQSMRARFTYFECKKLYAYAY